MIPKTNIHLHAETAANLDRLLAARHGRRSYDWGKSIKRLARATSQGCPASNGSKATSTMLSCAHLGKTTYTSSIG